MLPKLQLRCLAKNYKRVPSRFSCWSQIFEGERQADCYWTTSNESNGSYVQGMEMGPLKGKLFRLEDLVLVCLDILHLVSYSSRGSNRQKSNVRNKHSKWRHLYFWPSHCPIVWIWQVTTLLVDPPVETANPAKALRRSSSISHLVLFKLLLRWEALSLRLG
jgi:hypothetical protein